MSSFKCKLGFHDWNKYGDMVKGYSGLCQFRICKRCNLISFAKTYGEQANPSDINRTTGNEKIEDQAGG